MNIRVEHQTTFRGFEYWVATDDDLYDAESYAIASGHSKWDAVRELIDTLEEHDE